jgi:uncharacterized membrane protein YhaH (DUF805 family)
MSQTVALPAGIPARAEHRTGLLLSCGVVAGPLYLAVAAAQAVARDGYDITRHPLSLLSLGELGWIQVANFVLSGLLFVAGAVGTRQALRGGRGETWVPRLLGVFGGSLVWGGVFVADPYDGFPVGTPAGTGETSWHGILHNLAPMVGFLALLVTCIVLARRFRADGRPGWAAYSLVIGLALISPDFFLGQDWFGLMLALSAVAGWTWVSAVSARLLLDRDTR